MHAFLKFLLLLIANPMQLQHPAASASTPLNQPVYYFIEAQCQRCVPTAGHPTGKYMVVSKGIESGDFKDYGKILQAFRKEVAARYPMAPLLDDGLVFHFRYCADEALSFRRAYLAQRQKEGWEVMEMEAAGAPVFE